MRLLLMAMLVFFSRLSSVLAAALFHAYFRIEVG
jgi:hypothetical protein